MDPPVCYIRPGFPERAVCNSSGAYAVVTDMSPDLITSAEVADPDGGLVQETLAGDLAAFEELVDRHRPVVYRVAARVVGREEAEDVTQETFLRAYHRLPRFRGESAFRSWLLRIAHNTAVNAARRRLPEPVEVDEEGDQAVVAPAAREPVSALEESERRQRLELKLGELRARAPRRPGAARPRGHALRGDRDGHREPGGQRQGPPAPRAARDDRHHAGQHLRLGAAR